VKDFPMITNHPKDSEFKKNDGGGITNIEILKHANRLKLS
jgi:hypothetical protein